MPEASRFSFRSAWILGGALVLSAMIAGGAVKELKRSDDDITVTGSAKRDVSADFVVWKIDVSSRGPTQLDAAKATRDGTAEVKAFLAAKGFPDSVLTVHAPNTNTEMEYINNRATGRVLDYHVVQALEISSTDVDRVATLAGDPAALISSAHVPVVPGMPEYLFNHLPDLRGALTADAIRDAEKRAKEILDAVGSKPGKVRSVQVGVIQVGKRNSTEVSGEGMYDTGDRQKAVTAVVHVTFMVK